MAVDCFLKLDDIKGESVDQKHAGEIDVLSWSWGASQSATFQSGSGGGTAKVNVHDLTVTKYVDRSSPTLMGLCFTGLPIKSAILSMRKAGGTQMEYINISMEDCVVSSTGAANSTGEERLIETITLNFARVKFAYTPQKPDGSADAAVKFGYDIAKNVKWG
jgi:type VI secretion system secreted protein Hcp